MSSSYSPRHISFCFLFVRIVIVLPGRITSKFQYAFLYLKMCSIWVEQAVQDLVPIRTDNNLNEIWGHYRRKDWKRNTWNGCAGFWRVSADLCGNTDIAYTHTHKPYFSPQKTPQIPQTPKTCKKTPNQKPLTKTKSLTFRTSWFLWIFRAQQNQWTCPA